MRIFIINEITIWNDGFLDELFVWISAVVNTWLYNLQWNHVEQTAGSCTVKRQQPFQAVGLKAYDK